VVAHIVRGETRASDPSVPLVLLSFQDYVEALFLGTGLLAQTPQTGCPAGSGRMAGWPSGATVTVTLAASLNSEQQRHADLAVQQAPDATAGIVTGTTRVSSQVHPAPGFSEIVAQQADSSFAFPCSSAAAGCTAPQFTAPGVLSSANIVILPSSNPLGH